MNPRTDHWGTFFQGFVTGAGFAFALVAFAHGDTVVGICAAVAAFALFLCQVDYIRRL